MNKVHAFFTSLIGLCVALLTIAFSSGCFTPKQETSFQLCLDPSVTTPKTVMVYPPAGECFQARFVSTETPQGNTLCAPVSAMLPKREMTGMMVVNYGQTRIDKLWLYIPGSTEPVIVNEGIDKGRFVWNMIPAEKIPTVIVQPATAKTASR